MHQVIHLVISFRRSPGSWVSKSVNHYSIVREEVAIKGFEINPWTRIEQGTNEYCIASSFTA